MLKTKGTTSVLVNNNIKYELYERKLLKFPVVREEGVNNGKDATQSQHLSFFSGLNLKCLVR